MSGFVGIVHLDSVPVDRSLLMHLAEFQSFRGSDGTNIWLNGNVGFGHALLRTTEEAEHEHQPFTLDGKTWIVADARVDARHELIEKLRSHGHEDLAMDAPDVELILRAYIAWGNDCVLHLLGDFSFAIWDEPRQQLFCARDQMGVNPFYFAHLGSFVVFSNTLDCIRQHPAVSCRLNDQAIADFLLFEINTDVATTSFADIRRLPPAHRATWSRDGLRIERYWSMPIDEPLFYKRPDDYVDRFKELLRQAVTDRLRTNRLGVFMSGGLDSTALAAAARDLLQERYSTFDLRAFTMLSDYPVDERYYAGLVAERLRIPIHYRDCGAQATDPQWERLDFSTPEPNLTPWHMLIFHSFVRQSAQDRRVFFEGEGPDNAMHFEWRPYVSYMVRQRRCGRLFRDAFATLLSDRRLPFWRRLTNGLRQANSSEDSAVPAFPNWLNPKLESRLGLRDRWAEYRQPPSAPEHPLRPAGYASLHTALWQAYFGGFDAGETKSPCEFRHPFVDLRMLKFLLAIPPLPWCRSKYILRRAMRNTLPEPVLRRKKAAVSAEPVIELFESAGRAPLAPAEGLDDYVDVARLPTVLKRSMGDVGNLLCARSLNHWLHCSLGIRHNVRCQEDLNG